MSLISIVLKNLKKHALSTVITVTSVALGVALIISITIVQKETEKNYSQTSTGYDLIFSAKGSQLQATLNALYHIETSTGIIPYSLYETALRDPRVERVFPLYVGDSYRGFRVIGTSRNFLEEAQPIRDTHFRFKEGRNFERPLEGVIGAEVARRSGLSVGDYINIRHGLHEMPQGAEELIHDHAPVKIVGILQPSSTANDRVIFTDLYTTHALHDPSFHFDDHMNENNDLGGDDHSTHSHHHHTDDNFKITLKELDALLIKMVNPAAALQVAGTINYPTPANPVLAMNMRRDPYFPYKDQIMAVIPAMQIRQLMSIVGNAEVVLRIVAWFVIIVSMFGLLMAIYNTMESRKRDIAVMRALGARKSQLFTIIVTEAMIIAALGGLLGLLLGHGIVSYSADYLADVAGVYIDKFSFELYQFKLLALIIAIGAFSGSIPAIKAYMTDTVKNLGTGK